MPQAPLSSPVTLDFRHSFEAETRSLLRRRFLWFTGSIGLIGLLFLLATVTTAVLVAVFNPTPAAPATEPMTAVPSKLFGVGRDLLGAVAIAFASLCGYLACFYYVRTKKPPSPTILQISFWLLIGDGLIHVLSARLGFLGGLGMWGVLISHVLACSFLPWSPLQALRPFAILLAIDALLILLFARDQDGAARGIGYKTFMIALAAFAGAPGTLICWLRQSRRLEEYRLRFLQERYGEVRRELVDARRIHESLFPRPFQERGLRFRYLYEPMRQIGGDYLFAFHSPIGDGEHGRLNVVLLDVTGHGIAAALTVNRLYGELQRVYAENPDATPGEVLALLNRYVHLTLANHSVFATALCMSIDTTTDTLTVANGGHPPAFIRASDATIHELNSTAFVLGACADVDFEHGEVSVRFGPGDCLIAYTDGAIETRGADGRMFGISGMQRLIASTPVVSGEGWPRTILNTIDGYRMGPAMDDTLVVEIERLVTGSRAPREIVREARSAADRSGNAAQRV